MEKFRKFASLNMNRPRGEGKNADTNRSKREKKNEDIEEHSNFVTDFKEEKFSFTWRIENIHRNTLKSQEFLESPTFSTRFCGEVKWALRVYPRGLYVCQTPQKAILDNAVECEEFGVFLRRISTNSAKSSFKYRLFWGTRLSNLGEQKGCTYPFEGLGEIDMDSSLTENGIKGVLNHDYSVEPKLETLVVRCDIYVTNVFNTESPNIYTPEVLKSITLSDDLKDMYESGRFSDVTLQARDATFPVHKAVLASRSKVFDAMFQHDMKETQTNLVEIEDIEPEVLSNLLQYIYGGTVADFNISKAMSLYSVADKYLLGELKRWCSDVMLANMTVENVFQIAVLSDIHSDSELKEAVLNMFRNYTSDIFKRQEWKDLTRNDNHFGLVSEILQYVSADFITNC